MAMNRPKTYVYLAGPYGDRDPYKVIEERINVARRYAIGLALVGVPFYCPHLNSAHFEQWAPDASVEFWIAMCSTFVRGAWGIWLLPGWTNSAGSIAEKALAEHLGLEVFGPAHMPADVATSWNRYSATDGRADLRPSATDPA